MSRWIDADAVIARIAGQMSYEIEVETGNETDCVDLAEELLNDIPSIDIVRCKECKKAHLTYDGDCKYCDEWKDDDDNFITVYHDGNFYCGYGERKESE